MTKYLLVLLLRLRAVNQLTSQ